MNRILNRCLQAVCLAGLLSGPAAAEPRQTNAEKLDQYRRYLAAEGYTVRLHKFMTVTSASHAFISDVELTQGQDCELLLLGPPELKRVRALLTYGTGQDKAFIGTLDGESGVNFVCAKLPVAKTAKQAIWYDGVYPSTGTAIFGVTLMVSCRKPDSKPAQESPSGSSQM